MFKVFKSKKNGQWYWNLMAKNGKVICQSEGYKDQKTAVKGFWSVIKNSINVINPGKLLKTKTKDLYHVK